LTLKKFFKKKSDMKNCNCTQCGKTVNVTNDRYNKSKTKEFYCSKDCYKTRSKSLSKRNKSCTNCGKTFMTSKGGLKKNKTGKFYCCLDCMIIDSRKHFKTNEICTNFNKFCTHCNKEFYVKDKKSLRNNKTGKFYCSKECFKEHNFNKKLVTCKRCGKGFYKKQKELNRSIDSYCSRGCSILTPKGNKGRSKLEIYLEGELVKLFDSTDVEFNKRDVDGFNGLELDIYFPKLKLAFELNGPTHYYNIFGGLDRVSKNDKRKIELCYNNGINLHIIDVCSLKVENRDVNERYIPYYQFIIKTVEFYQNRL
jgi:hypothetical protein